MHRAWIVVASLALASGSALADVAVAVDVQTHVDVVVTDAGAAPAPSPSGGGDLTFCTPLTRPHWEAGLGMALPLGFGDLGLHAVIGRQVGSFRIAAEYTLANVDGDRPGMILGGPAMVFDDGQQQRLGLAARYRLGMGMPNVGTGVYLEAGLGRATTTWSASGTSRHDDVLLGIGFEMMGGGRRTIGMDLGGRFLIADSDEVGGGRETVGSISLDLLFGG